jgi:hypothetical protein
MVELELNSDYCNYDPELRFKSMQYSINQFNFKTDISRKAQKCPNSSDLSLSHLEWS